MMGHADAELDTIFKLRAALYQLNIAKDACRDIVYLTACEIAQGILIELIADFKAGQ